MRYVLRGAALALLVASGACASANGSTARTHGRGSATLITEEELSDNTAANLYDAVLSRRPLWLQKRGQISINNPTEVLVYVDNMRMGGVGELRQIQVSSVKEVQYLDGNSAQQRFGIGNGNGAILVVTRHSP